MQMMQFKFSACSAFVCPGTATVWRLLPFTTSERTQRHGTCTDFFLRALTHTGWTLPPRILIPAVAFIQTWLFGPRNEISNAPRGTAFPSAVCHWAEQLWRPHGRGRAKNLRIFDVLFPGTSWNDEEFKDSICFLSQELHVRWWGWRSFALEKMRSYVRFVVSWKQGEKVCRSSDAFFLYPTVSVTFDQTQKSDKWCCACFLRHTNSTLAFSQHCRHCCTVRTEGSCSCQRVHLLLQLVVGILSFIMSHSHTLGQR